jgi:DNA polymerase-3 subunit beta
MSNLVDEVMASGSTTTVVGHSTSVVFEVEMKKFVLQSLLEKASAVVPTRDILPVLKNFQIEAFDNRVRVTATDLELSVVVGTEMVTVTVPGVAVFPAKKLLTIVREAGEGDVHISVVGGQATVSIGRTSWTLKLQPGDDYPPMINLSSLELHSVNRVVLLSALSTVRYVVPRSGRPSLQMVQIANGKATACDGVRFQQASVGDDFPVDMRIPVGAVDDLLKLLKVTDQESIQIGVSDNCLVFKIGSDFFIANQLIAQFPDVESMLLRPALSNTHELVVDRSSLQEAVRRVRITADPETSAVTLSLSRGSLIISSTDKFGNKCIETLEVKWSASPRMLVINHSFVTDMLDAHKDQSCKFMIGDDIGGRKSPLLLRDDTAKTVGVCQQMITG